MSDTLDEKWTKLLAIAERLAGQGPPTINVNVYTDAPKKKRVTDQNRFGEAQAESSDAVETNGMPRPYVS